MLLELSVDIELLDAADANIESMPDVAGDVERAFGMLNVTYKSQKYLRKSHRAVKPLPAISCISEHCRGNAACMDRKGF